MSHIAHIRKTDKEPQSLAAHSFAVSEIAGNVAEKIGLRLAGQLAGLTHDFGKYSEKFKTYIQSAEGLLDPDQDEEWVDADRLKGKIDHSSAGAQWIWQALSLPEEPKTSEEKVQQLTAQMLALVVASHHSGLVDCVAADPQLLGQDCFMRRIKKDDKNTHLAEVRTKLDDGVRQRLQELLNSEEMIASVRLLKQRMFQVEKQYQGNKGILQCKLGMVTRFLLSGLVEGDHRNSGEFEYPETKQIRKERKPDWAALSYLLENRIKEFSNSPNPSKIDSIRADISTHCLAAAKRDRGIYTLTVPTGGGKTLASLRFALHHAQEHKLDRIIYVIPFTSIIDQNAEEVRKILEPNGTALGSVLLEHHSNLLPEKMTWQHKLLSENWNAPIIYTTSVQLLEALFGSGTRNVRRMHALARSALIFDEVQALPLKCAHLFSNALNFLVEQAGSSVVLCTATQPLLHEIDAQLGAVRLAQNNHELMPNVGKLFADLKRTDIIDYRRLGGWAYEAASELAVDIQRKFRSVLFIANTKRAAREIFGYCRKRADVPTYHLSTNMCPAHRREILKEIKKKLDNSEPMICVSTQLIEAGVDVSFGSVIRSLAGMDSVGQAAGRCNRHGEQTTPAPVFIINLAEEEIDLLPEITDGQQATERLLDEFSKAPAVFQHSLLADQAMHRYFEYYFFRRKESMGYPVRLDRMSYIEKNADVTLLSLLSSNSQAVREYKKTHEQKTPIYPLHQAFRIAAQAFKVIDLPTQSIIVPHGKEGRNIIAELNGDLHPERLNGKLREAQQFSVNLFERDVEKLQDAKALYSTPLGIWCLHLEYYWNDFGVSFEPRELTDEERGEFIQ